MDNNPVFSCVFCSFVLCIQEHVLIGYRQQMVAEAQIQASLERGNDNFHISIHKEHLFIFKNI